MNYTPEALTSIDKKVNEYRKHLTGQALRQSGKAEIVLKEHVDEASKIIKRSENENRWYDFRMLMSGALLGGFFQGLASELLKESIQREPVIVYVIMGFVGMLIWGFNHRE